jgi:hypothetical protein
VISDYLISQVSDAVGELAVALRKVRQTRDGTPFRRTVERLAGELATLATYVPESPPEAPVAPSTGLPDRRWMGSTQRALWFNLRNHGSWSWGCGWDLVSNNYTERLCKQLVNRNLAVCEHKNGKFTYRVIPGAMGE